MHKRISQIAMLIILFTATVNLTSCSKDDDETIPAVAAAANVDNGSADNYITVSGGPFNNYKFEFSGNTTLVRAWNVSNDSTILYMNKNSSNYATAFVKGNSTGNYTWAGGTQLAIILQHNNTSYIISCDNASQSGSLNISAFGNVGGKVKGTITASTTAREVSTGAAIPVTIDGKFDMTRGQ